MIQAPMVKSQRMISSRSCRPAAIKSFICCVLANFVAGQELPFGVKKVGELTTWAIDDGRPAKGSGKHAIWLGDRNGDGIAEYLVSTKTGGTTTLFYSTSEEGKWEPTSHWYMPSYSLIALDTRGDAKPEYIIKTSKLQNGADPEWFADHVPGMEPGYTTVLKIPDDPINDPLEVVMTFDRAVPIAQGCLDIDGDGYKDLLVTHHTKSSNYVARYYKGKDDSEDGLPFEATHQWASTGAGSSMEGSLKQHKARWGDIQIIKEGYNYGGTTFRKRLFVTGSEGEKNNVIYWDYNKATDTFDEDPTVLDVSSLEYAENNELNMVSVRTLSGAAMLAGSDGVYFLKYNKDDDTYSKIDVPGMLPPKKTRYSDFWCFNSGKNDGTMVFVILNKPKKGDSVMEFRTFNPSLSENQISDILMEVPLPPNAQRLTALRVDNSFDVNKDAKQFIVAHKRGATIYEVVPNSDEDDCKDTADDFRVKGKGRKDCEWAKKKKKKNCERKLKSGDGKVKDMCPDTCGTKCR